MATESARIRLLLEVVDSFTNPLRKAREQAKLFAEGYNDIQREIRQTGNQIRQDMARIERVDGLKKRLTEDQNALKEVTEKLKLFERALDANKLTSKKSADALIGLRREQDRLTESIQKSEGAIQDETQALQAQGVSMDRLGDHIEELRKKEEALARQREAAKVTVQQARAEAEHQRILSEKERDTAERQRARDKDERDRESAREKRVNKGQEFLGMAAASYFSGLGILGASLSPIKEAMQVQAGVQEIFAKGLFEDRFQMTPLDQAFAKENLQRQALRLGSELPGFDSLDVLKLQKTAITQGRSYSNNPEKNQITDEFLRSILNFSLVDKMEPDAAYNMLESLRKSYKLPDSATGILADKLAYTSVKSGATTQELGDSFGRVQGLAANLKVPYETMLSFTRVISDFGNIRGREAGTQMLNMLTALVAPDNATAKELKQLGFSVKDEETGQMKPLSQLMRELGDITKGWDDVRRAELFKGVGNQEGISTLMTAVDLAGTDEGMAELQKIERESAVESSVPGQGIKGTVQAIGDELKKGLVPALDELSASISNLKIAIGGPELGNFEKIVRVIGSAMDRVTAFFARNELAGQILIWGGLATAVGFFATAIGLVIGGLVLLWPIIQTGIVIGAGIIAAITAIVTLFYKLWEGINIVGDKLKEFWNTAVKFAEDIKKLFESIGDGSFWGSLFSGNDATLTVRRDAQSAPISTLSDTDFQQRVREERIQREREVFQGAGGFNRQMEFNAQVTVNAQTNANPDEIARTVVSGLRGESRSLTEEASRRLGD